MTRRPILAAALAGTLLLAAACGDDDDSGTASEPTSDGTPAGTSEATDGGAPADAVSLTLQSNSIRGGKNDQEATYLKTS